MHCFSRTTRSGEFVGAEQPAKVTAPIPPDRPLYDEEAF